MNPSRPFILRPVATSLLMAALLMAGGVAYRFLPLSALPEVDYPTIQVQTFYPGASPDVIATSITAPLERQLGQMPGLIEMASSSGAGASSINLQFSLDLELDVAEQEVQAAINAANNLLPTDLPAPPVYAKVNPADAPVLTLGLTSTTLPPWQIQDIADTRLAQKISQLPGVGVVRVGGGQRPAVRVQADPRALAAYGLSLDDVRTTVAAANSNLPKGTLDGPTRAWAIDANDQLTRPEDFRSLVLAWRNGAPVRLSDVAAVVDGPENTKVGATVNGLAGVLLEVRRQPGANVIQVVDQIKQLLPELTRALPPTIEVTLLSDRTTTIRASVRDVQIELGLAVALVVLVIFLFLGSFRATLIPSLSVPLSLIGTLAVMQQCGFSLNNLSLMALTIATGFVVDDAIVMIENISRYLEKGYSPFKAALEGSAQIGFTIVSLTVSLIAVLIPLLFMGDVVGRLFREFAVTLAVTILISAAVSLTLVPMMCGRILQAPTEKRPPLLARLATAASQGMIALYGRMLRVVLDHRGLTLLVAAATLVLTGVLYLAIPKGFFPVQDTGLIQGITEAPQNISYGAMALRQQALAQELLKDPAVRTLSSVIGVDGTNGTLNSGRFLIDLKPVAERQVPVTEVIRRLNQRAVAVAGIKLFLQPLQDLTIDATVARTPYRFVVVDPDPARLAEGVPRLVERLSALPQLTGVASDLHQQGLGLSIVIDRDRAARFGISVSAIDSALYNAFGQRIISTIFSPTNQYRVILEANPEVARSVQALSALYLPASKASSSSSSTSSSSTSGSQSPAEQVPLSALVTVEEVAVALEVNHIGQFPSATISFDLAPGISLGTAVEAIRQGADEAGLLHGSETRFQGAALAFQSSLASQLLLILAAVLTMYIVLGVLYESYIHPITILSTLPSAGVGALIALMAAGSPLDVIGIIGIVLLIGIVKKNAILMIDFALEAERQEGKSPRDAIFQACLLRFRPILMTTLAALFGALPLMLGEGTGSELRHPLGVAIVGGLVVSQALTLFTTPVIYLTFADAARALGRAKVRGSEA